MDESNWDCAALHVMLTVPYKLSFLLGRLKFVRCTRSVHLMYMSCCVKVLPPQPLTSPLLSPRGTSPWTGEAEGKKTLKE